MNLKCLLLILLCSCRGEQPPESNPSPAAARPVPARPAVPPVVTDTDGLIANSQQWVELRGRLIQHVWEESTKARNFTEMVLDDGARVTLTYGDPPADWEPLLGQRLALVGLLTLCGRWEAGQSLFGPHLQRWEEPRVIAEVVTQEPAEGDASARKRLTDHCLGR